MEKEGGVDLFSTKSCFYAKNSMPADPLNRLLHEREH